MIERPTIIITSLGRTGTRFFATLLEELLSNATSLHEPDVFQVVIHGENRIKKSVERIADKIKEVGIENILFKKSLGQWSLIRLSDARVRGILDDASAIKCISKQREQFVHSRPGSVYVESNAGYYGLIDLLDAVYKNYKAAFLVRDGRSWVQSKMNWGEMYGKGKIRSLIAHTWPTASDLDQDHNQWDAMSRFERVCWAWDRLNRYSLDKIKQNPHVQVFKFENVFEDEDRYQHLQGMIEFFTSMPEVENVSPEAFDGWLKRKIHKSSGCFPAWPDWTPEQKRKFVEICGPLMDELGYQL